MEGYSKEGRGRINNGVKEWRERERKQAERKEGERRKKLKKKEGKD